MSAVKQLSPIAAAEYLTYDQTSEGKHELVDGEIVALGGERSRRRWLGPPRSGLRRADLGPDLVPQLGRFSKVSLDLQTLHFLLGGEGHRDGLKSMNACAARLCWAPFGMTSESVHRAAPSLGRQ